MTTENKYSYIVADNQVLARIDARSPKSIKYSFQLCKENINASRDINLVNARRAKISNAKKWEKKFRWQEHFFSAKEVNPNEWLLA